MINYENAITKPYARFIVVRGRSRTDLSAEQQEAAHKSADHIKIFVIDN